MKMRSKIVQVFPSDNNWSALFKEDGNFSTKKVYFWCCREEDAGSQEAGAFLVMNGVCKNDEGILAEVYENPEEFCSYIHLNDDSQYKRRRKTKCKQQYLSLKNG